MIKTHDRQGILDYFKELGMEIRSIEFQGWYKDMIYYPIVDNNGTINLYEIADLENEKLYKLNRTVERFDNDGCYWLTEKDKKNTVKIPYKKVVEKENNIMEIYNKIIYLTNSNTLPDLHYLYTVCHLSLVTCHLFTNPQNNEL